MEKRTQFRSISQKSNECVEEQTLKLDALESVGRCQCHESFNADRTRTIDFACDALSSVERRVATGRRQVCCSDSAIGGAQPRARGIRVCLRRNRRDVAR